MSQTVGIVSSSITLVAFLAAVAATILMRKISAKEKLIKTANPEDRKDLISQTLEVFHVDTGNLTKQQQYDIAMEKIRQKAKRFKYIIITVTLIALLAIPIALLALSKEKPTPTPNPSANTSPVTNPLSTTDKSATADTLPTPISTSLPILRLRENIESQLQSCWDEDDFQSCETAAYSLSKYCTRINNNEDPIRQVPNGYCGGNLGTSLAHLSRSLRDPTPSQGTQMQILALKRATKTSAGVITFNFPTQ